MKKTYVLDTNVLINDPDSIWAFEDNDVVVPMVVIEELDNLKNRPDTGQNARYVSRKIDDLRQKGNLYVGVQLPGGGVFKICSTPEEFMDQMPFELRDRKKSDNVLIATAYWLSTKLLDEACILVTKDVNVRIKCDAINVKCEDYMKNRITSDKKQFYKGVAVFEDIKWSSLIASIYAGSQNPSLEYIEVPPEMQEDNPVYSNQIVVVKDGIHSSIITTIVECQGKKCFKRIGEHKDVMSLKPRNKEQNFALSLLMNPDIKLVTLCGNAGTGKTILSIAAGLDQLSSIGSAPVYDRMVITRPIQTVGKDLGFLPGTLQEKMDPWITPIKDNLNFLVGYKKAQAGAKRMKTGSSNVKDENDGVEPYLSLLMKNGLIEIEAIPYIRGRSIPGAYLVIDEAQNLSVHELKTIITRSGEGTKVVLTGDLEQIDNSHVDIYTNGLAYAIEKFKDHSIAGHITLLKGERSALATLASQIL
jgi:PhoH-like ATPase